MQQKSTFTIEYRTVQFDSENKKEIYNVWHLNDNILIEKYYWIIYKKDNKRYTFGKPFGTKDDAQRAIKELLNHNIYDYQSLYDFIQKNSHKALIKILVESLNW